MVRAFGYDFQLEFAQRGRPSTRTPDRKSDPFPMLRSTYRDKPINPALRTFPKRTPYNLRALAEDPFMRRALNTVKNQVLGKPWVIRVRKGITAKPEHLEQIRISWNVFSRPNVTEPLRKMMGMHLEDLLTGGWGPLETQQNADPEHPWWIWVPDGPSIEIIPFWDGKPNSIHYAQRISGTNHKILFSDMEMFYVVPNARPHTPYGLGPGEIVFNTMNQFLAAHLSMHRHAANEIPERMLHLGKDATPDEVEDFRIYWEDMIEGTGRWPIIGGTEAPEVMPLASNSDPSWKLKWQELLITAIACGFDVSPGKLGFNKDVNRSTKDGQMQEDDETSIDPWARLIADEWTFNLLWKRMGYYDLELSFEEYNVGEELICSQALTNDWNNNAITVNEYRLRRNYVPLDDAHGSLRKNDLAPAVSPLQDPGQPGDPNPEPHRTPPTRT